METKVLMITKSQIRAIRAIAAQLRWDNERLHDVLYDNYKVEHCGCLTIGQAAEFIQLLQDSDPKRKELVVWRKRAIASVGGYRELQGYNRWDIQAIKTTIMRRTSREYEDFNLIPVSELKEIWGFYRKLQATWKRNLAAEGEIVAQQAVMN